MVNECERVVLRGRECFNARLQCIERRLLFDRFDGNHAAPGETVENLAVISPLFEDHRDGCDAACAEELREQRKLSLGARELLLHGRVCIAAFAAEAQRIVGHPRKARGTRAQFRATEAGRQDGLKRSPRVHP
jgi:hypothetical protein